MVVNETLKRSLATGAKVAGYILVSVLLTVLTSTAFNDWLKIQVNDTTLFAVINVALAAFARAIKEQTEEGSSLRKFL